MITVCLPRATVVTAQLTVVTHIKFSSTVWQVMKSCGLAGKFVTFTRERKTSRDHAGLDNYSCNSLLRVAFQLSACACNSDCAATVFH